MPFKMYYDGVRERAREDLSPFCPPPPPHTPPLHCGRRALQVNILGIDCHSRQEWGSFPSTIDDRGVGSATFSLAAQMCTVYMYVKQTGRGQNEEGTGPPSQYFFYLYKDNKVVLYKRSLPCLNQGNSVKALCCVIELLWVLCNNKQIIL